jgi:hypothetical protein
VSTSLHQKNHARVCDRGDDARGGHREGDARDQIRSLYDGAMRARYPYCKQLLLRVMS